MSSPNQDEEEDEQQETQLHSPLLRYDANLAVAATDGQAPSCRASSLWEENNLPDIDLLGLLPPDVAIEAAVRALNEANDWRPDWTNVAENGTPELRSASDMVDGDYREDRSFCSEDTASVPEGDDDQADWSAGDCEMDAASGVAEPASQPTELLKTLVRSVSRRRQLAALSALKKAHRAPRLLSKRNVTLHRSISSQRSIPSSRAVNDERGSRLSQPTFPRLILDKLQEQGRAVRLDGEDKTLAKIIRWKLKQIGLRRIKRQDQEQKNPALSRWALLQQLVRQPSDEQTSITPSVAGLGDLDAVDVADSAISMASSIEAIFTLIDDNAVNELATALRSLPADMLIRTKHPMLRLNILQYALVNGKLEMAKIIVELVGSGLVLESNFPSAESVDEIETCLHKAVALGSLPLVRAVLKAFGDSARAADYLKAETLVVLHSSRMVNVEADSGGLPADCGDRDGRGTVDMLERTRGSVLHLAAALGHFDIVRYLVDDAAQPVDACNNRGATPISLAVAHNNLSVVDFLHGAGASLELVDATSRTFLHYAILSGNENTVDYALALFKRASKRRQILYRAENPLVMAAWHGRCAVVRSLLDDPEIRALCDLPTPHHGNTALHVACSRRNPDATDIVRQLLNVGATVDVRNKEGKTPLMSAAETGAVDAIILLAEYMTAPRARYFQVLQENGKSVWDYAIALSGNAIMIGLLEAARFCCEIEAAEECSSKPCGRERSRGDQSATCPLANGSDSKDAWRKKLQHLVRLPEAQGGTTPLHMAAAKGDVAKLRVMLKYGFRPEKMVDCKGDTFLHTAAREGQLKVIRTFATRPLYVNHQNANGDSVLSVACSAGQQDCVSVLLPKADMSLVNRRQRTAVHELCALPDLPLSLLRDVVRRTADLSWDMLAYEDQSGRSALHLLAVHPNLVEREAVFKLFYQPFASNPICNAVRIGGYMPLHDALHNRCVDNACALLKTFGSSLNVNATDNCGRTPLHVAVQECLLDAVMPLIQCGADLMIADARGDTPLHTLVTCASERPKHLNEYIKLLHKLLDCMVTWYCKFKDIVPIPKKSSDEHHYKQYLKSAVTLLLTAVYNSRDMNVLMWATFKCGGSKELLTSLLTVPDVFCLQRVGRETPREGVPEYVYYDVTDIVPDTLVVLRQAALLDSGITPTDFMMEEAPYSDRPVKEVMRKAYMSMASDAEWQTAYNAKPALVKIVRPKHRSSSPKQSLVEIIVGSRDRFKEKRWQLLDVSPIREITMDYWGPYKYIYAVLMIIHIAYMAVFSELSLRMTASVNLTCLYAANGTSDDSKFSTVREHPAELGLNSLLLIWPCLIVISDSLYCFLYFLRRCSKSTQSVKRGVLRSLTAPFRQLEIVYVNAYWLFGISFSWLAIAWFVLYALGNCHQDYVLAVAMITGWLYAINFTQGIRGVHHFSLVLQRIVLKDFLKFSFVFASLLVGYSYAFQVLTLSIPSLRKQFPSLGYTFFTVFNWLIGMDEFYKVEREEFASLGKEAAMLNATFVSYILLLNIVLVNLLVAIMNDSYSSIYQRHQLVWRISSLQHALDIENHFPFVGNVLRQLRSNEIVRDSFSQHKRFYLKVRAANVDNGSSAEADSAAGEQSSLAAISSRLDSLAVAADRFEQAQIELKDRLELLTASERKDLRPPASPSPTSETTADMAAAADEAARKLSEYVKTHILTELTRKVKRTT